MHSTSAKTVIPKLDRIFAAYGVPQVVKSDNGPPFSGHEFAQFAEHLGFKHRKVTPLWPEANSEVGRYMKTFGKVLGTITSWKRQMYQFLRNYRATPHCTTGVAPATTLFGRPIRIKLPCPVSVPCETDFNPTLMRERYAYQKRKMKSHAECKMPIRDSGIQVGDTVLVKQPRRGKLSTPYHPIPMTVTSMNYSMLTAEGGERKVTRKSSHFKKYLSDEPACSLSDVDLPNPLKSPVSASQNDTGSVLVDPSAKTPTDPQLRRSSCVSKPPIRLIQEIRSKTLIVIVVVFNCFELLV